MRDRRAAGITCPPRGRRLSRAEPRGGARRPRARTQRAQQRPRRTNTVRRRAGTWRFRSGSMASVGSDAWRSARWPRRMSGSSASTTSSTPTLLAHLLKWDSVHGQFPGTVTAEKDALVVNGQRIPVSAERDPAKLPWKSGARASSSSPRACSRRAKGEGTPRGGRRARDHQRARRRSGRDPGARRQRRAYDPAKHFIVSQRLVHDELPRARGEGAERQLRHRARADGDDPRLHVRPGLVDFAAQGPAPRARRRPLDDPDQHRRRERDRPRAARAEGQARRLRHARADAGRLRRGPHRPAEEAATDAPSTRRSARPPPAR